MATVPARPDTVAHVPRPNALAYSSDAADDLVPRSHRAVRTLSVSKFLHFGILYHLQTNTKRVLLGKDIGMADTAGLNLDQDFILAGKLQGGFFDAKARPYFGEDCLLEGFGKSHDVVWNLSLGI
jgi:hypothetical protein